MASDFVSHPLPPLLVEAVARSSGCCQRSWSRQGQERGRERSLSEGQIVAVGVDELGLAQVVGVDFKTKFLNEN